MAKKKFTKKNEVTHLIRDFFREGGNTSNLNEVLEMVKGLNEKYFMPPELLAFVLQKINAFQLFQVFKDNKSKQVYPKIDLIDVVKFCKDNFGYDDIYKTINSTLLSKIDERTPIKKAASLDYYSSLKKAASKNENIKNTLEEDEKMTDLNKFASSKLHYKFSSLIENYWSLTGIETFIKVAGLDTDLKLNKSFYTCK